jgi:fatty acid desaturase
MEKNRSASEYKLSRFQQLVELSRPWILLGVYVFFAYRQWWWLAVPVGVAVGFAGFVQMHDSIHNSLGLSKKWNSFFLTMSALLILKSGHGLRVTHLRHHGQCLSDHDPEGEPAKWTLSQVFIDGPYHTFTLRRSSLQMSPNTRRIQLAETLITLLILTGFVALYFVTGSVGGLVYWAVAFVLSSLMPLWASYIPHKLAPRNPARLLGVKFSRIWTPIISSFAYHHFHHTYPKVPTALLPKAAAELPEPEEEEHHHH